jgi:peptide chain release factor 3
VFAVVGPMQFEVAAHRMEHEFHAPVHLEPLPYTLAMRTDEASAAGVAARSGTEVMQRTDGEFLALFTTKWVARVVREGTPELTLEPLVAAQLG